MIKSTGTVVPLMLVLLAVVVKSSCCYAFTTTTTTTPLSSSSSSRMINNPLMDQRRRQQQQHHLLVAYVPYHQRRKNNNYNNNNSNNQRIISRLYGILDEIQSDSYTISSDSNKSKKNDDNNSNKEESQLSDAYDLFLAELVFSTNDPRVDVANKIELAADPEFLLWLDNKIQTSSDPAERIGLRDLYDIILDVKTKIEVNKLSKERKEIELKEQEEQQRQKIEHEHKIAEAEGQNMSTADILKKATAIQTAIGGGGSGQQEGSINNVKKEKKTFYEQELTPEIRHSYEGLLKKVLPPYKTGDSPASIVFKFYDQFDAQFVKLLTERSSGDDGDVDSKALLEALAVEQQKRITAATQTLKDVLMLGEPMRMEGAIVKLAREGKIDEAFLLLLEANADQAKAAGADGPAKLMSRLRKRAVDEKDKQATSKEIRLLRQLLRTDDATERERLLEDAFTPRDALLVPGTMENAQKAVDGQAPEQAKPMPEVPPPDFINACKAVLLNFGNLEAGDSGGFGYDSDDSGDLASRIKKLASEAEVVATRIYGQGMTLREQQDRMWKEQTTSIFDLERMEIEAERHGEVAPWANPDADDDMFLPGFDKDGRMQVGGQ